MYCTSDWRFAKENPSLCLQVDYRWIDTLNPPHLHTTSDQSQAKRIEELETMMPGRLKYVRVGFVSVHFP